MVRILRLAILIGCLALLLSACLVLPSQPQPSADEAAAGSSADLQNTSPGLLRVG